MFPSILLKRAELIGINLFISRSAIFLLKNTTAPFSDFFKSLLGAHGRIKQIRQTNVAFYFETFYKVYSEREKEFKYGFLKSFCHRNCL